MTFSDPIPPTPVPAGPRFTGWMIVAIIGIVGAVILGVTALVTTHSSTGSPTSSSMPTKDAKVPTKDGKATTTTPVPTTTVPVTVTTASPTTTTESPVVPLVLVCEGTPEYEPTSLSWCSSRCSSYVDGITWTSWTAQSAVGTGTLYTNDGIPDCAQGTVTAQPGYQVTMGNPQTTGYCNAGGQVATGLLFTSSDVFQGDMLPDIVPPCS